MMVTAWPETIEELEYAEINAETRRYVQLWKERQIPLLG